MKPFVLRAHLRSPIIRRGFVTLDALLMAILSRGDVSDLLRCEQDLYFASSGFAVDAVASQRASFVASMRPEHSPHWLDVLNPSTKDGDLRIGLSRQREAGNIINGYQATVARAIEWYATGHADAVLEVLQPVRFIGKKRSAGYGEVARWEVEGASWTDWWAMPANPCARCQPPAGPKAATGCRSRPPGRRRTGRFATATGASSRWGSDMNGPEFFMQHAGYRLLPAQLKSSDPVDDADTLFATALPLHTGKTLRLSSCWMVITPH